MDEQRKKVLYVITKDDVGGAQKYVADLASHLDPVRFNAHIIRGGIDIPSLSNKISSRTFFANDFRAMFELLRTYRKEMPDVIHLNSSKAGVVGSFAAGLYKLSLAMSHKSSLRVIFTAHGWVFNPSNALSPWVRLCYRLLHTFAAFFQDTIICVSEYDRMLALSLRIAPARKLITIHNGIDYQNLKFSDKVSARKRILETLHPKPYTLNPNLPWIGSIGRLTKEKDYKTLIAAAQLVPKAFFFIIGAGPEEKNLESRISNLKINESFFIVSPTGEDAKFLKAFDIFVLSSIKEGLPYALLEAMAAGLPTVVTNTGGLPEAVLDEKTGFVVPPKDPSAFAKALMLLLKERALQETFSREAKNRVQTRFSLEDMVALTEKIYKD